jgi:hypothetical protein
METNNLVPRLMELPKAIVQKQVEILDLSSEVQKISNDILKHETQLRVKISGMTDDNNKKLYSNEDARRAAFDEIAEDDIDLVELKEKLRKTDFKLQESKIDFEALSNEQRNIRSILAFLSTQQELSL